jgi:hypothetical protein
MNVVATLVAQSISKVLVNGQLKSPLHGAFKQDTSFEKVLPFSPKKIKPRF